MTKKLAGKVAVITGGNSGMGLATARHFVEHGAKVIITGRRQKDLDEAVADIGGDIEGIKGDVSNLADLDKLFDHIKKEYGRVDVLFANAGIAQFAPFEQTTEEQFDQMFNINVKGLFFTVQKLLPLIGKGGSIILNASVVSSKGMEAATVYSATKAAVRSFARTLTTDLKGRGIRVNVISPGPIETPIFGKTGMDAAQIQTFTEGVALHVPLGRIGHVDEIAKSALFLASNDSSFITGIELNVDGGMGAV